MKALSLLLAPVALLGASCIGEARATPPLRDLTAETTGFVPPLSLSEQVSAQLGVSLEVPRALARLSPAEIVDIVHALPAGVPLDVVSLVPGVGPAYVDSFTVSCTSAADALIQPSGGAMVSYTCQNASTTMVAVGDSAISDPGTTRDAPIYCATNCPSQEWGGNARVESCRGDTDTTIYCRALVAVASAP